MKILLLSLSMLMNTLLLGNELSWVNKQIEAIKPPRSGMSTKILASLHTPFIFLKKNRVKGISMKSKGHRRVTDPKRKTSSKIINRPRLPKLTYSKILKLYTIINNSVMINKKWYKIGDSINGYKVQEISYNSVLLVKNKKKLLLSTKSRYKTIKFQNK